MPRCVSATPTSGPADDAELQKALVEVTPEVIVNAVDELLLIQRGRELGYALGAEQFRNIVENIKKENKIETEEQFQAALKQEGMTLEDLRKQIERQHAGQPRPAGRGAGQDRGHAKTR